MTVEIIGIYSISNGSNGKKYIGASKDVLVRLSNHKKLLAQGVHQNKEMQHDFYTCRQDFEFEVLEVCEEKELKEKEDYYMDLYNTNEKNGYNSVASGYPIRNIPKDYQLGQLLKTMRLKEGLSQQELAEKIGVSRSNVSRIERGVLELKASILIKWSAVTNSISLLSSFVLGFQNKGTEGLYER